MKFSSKVIFIFVVIVVAYANDPLIEAKAKPYMDEVDKKLSQFCNLKELAQWELETNVTPDTTIEAINQTSEFYKFQAQSQAEFIKKFPNWKDVKDPLTKRQMDYIVHHGGSNMSVDDMTELTTIAGSINNIVMTTTICNYHNKTNCDMKLEPDIESIMEKSTDPNELAYYYTEWHNTISEVIPKESYLDYIEVLNKLAKANYFDTVGELLLSDFDDESPEWSPEKFLNSVRALWTQIQPLYKKLHAFIRMRLRGFEKYKGIISKCGPIPVHLIGNMGYDLHQSREALDKIARPYPTVEIPQATKALKENGYTSRKIFKTAEKFFTEMGLPKMTTEFWNKSMLEQPPPPREVSCETSAEDLCAGKNSTDFRIKHCTTISHESLITAYHEMTHIQYYMHYAHHPYLFRFGPNPSVSEALADAIDMIASNARHLTCALGLNVGVEIDCSAKKSTQPSKSDLNFLFYLALQHFTQLSFTIAQNRWRWEIIKGKIKPDQYNTRWWEIRREIQGVVPPSERPPSMFDPAGKHQNLIGIDGLNYFLAYVLQNQFFEALCKAAGEYDPANPQSLLYKCNFYGNKQAGKKMADMMSLGSSQPWPDVIAVLTDTKTISVQPLINFYKPLFEFIDKQLAVNKEPINYDGQC